MYMSQGALFFASYEFFKRSFSLEKPQTDSQRIQYQQKMEDDPVSPSSFPLPSTPSRLHGLHSWDTESEFWCEMAEENEKQMS